MSKFTFDKGEIPFRSDKIRIYSGFPFYYSYYSVTKVMLSEKRVVILRNDSKKNNSWAPTGSHMLQEATLNDFFSKLIKDQEEQVLSIDYGNIVSVELKRANPLVSFFLWNWFYYIHLIYQGGDRNLQKIKFFCYIKQHSRFWRVNNGGTKRVFEDIRRRMKDG